MLPNNERTILRIGAALTGLLLLAASAMAADLAAEHMASLGAICGAAAAHCGWCYAAAALALSGAGALAAAIRPGPANPAVRAG